jgi:hypothetical protein
MADKPRQGFWEQVRLWLSAVGLPVVLAGAGLWQFYLKEVWWPESAINLTTEVSIKQVGFSTGGTDASKNLEAIEVAFSARNPSSRTVYLCANYWGAWGTSVTARTQGHGESEDWLNNVTDEINSRVPTVTGKHFKRDSGALVAAGNVFAGDTYLRPQEKISAVFAVYIPEGLYDLIEIFAVLPTTSRESSREPLTPALGVYYALSPDRSRFNVASIYRIKPDGISEKVPYDAENQRFVDANDATYYGFQVYFSTAALSLRKSKPSPQ